MKEILVSPPLPLYTNCFSDSVVAPLKVIHQLKQLATVWQDVLPVSIYCKAMGNLLNTAISEIIAKTMMLEVCGSFCKSSLSPTVKGDERTLGLRIR